MATAHRWIDNFQLQNSACRIEFCQFTDAVRVTPARRGELFELRQERNSSFLNEGAERAFERQLNEAFRRVIRATRSARVNGLLYLYISSIGRDCTVFEKSFIDGPELLNREIPEVDP